MKKLKTDASLLQSCVSKSVILPNELRIGNLFENAIITSISEEGYNYSDYPEMGVYWKTFDTLKTIPINEDLLCKLGFNKIGGTYELCDGLIELVYAKDRMYEVIEGQWKSLEHIKYMHQLQNIYFALTGRELTVC
jgi:hypothetical protein